MAAGPPRRPGGAAGHSDRGGDLLARRPTAAAGYHPRALQRGGWVVDQTHWDGLPNRNDAELLPPCTGDAELIGAPQPGQLELPGIAGWTRLPAARGLVAHRTLATYDHAGGLR